MTPGESVPDIDAAIAAVFADHEDAQHSGWFDVDGHVRRPVTEEQAYRLAGPVADLYGIAHEVVVRYVQETDDSAARAYVFIPRERFGEAFGVGHGDDYAAGPLWDNGFMDDQLWYLRTELETPFGEAIWVLGFVGDSYSDATPELPRLDRVLELV